jgi:hypothetical protein
MIVNGYVRLQRLPHSLSPRMQPRLCAALTQIGGTVEFVNLLRLGLVYFS